MPIITIDDKELEVPAGYTVIQACEMAGVEIPRFCYHERLAIAGNCRMCLVEVSPGPPKPQASCALPVADKMVVKTNTPMVKKAREGVMEFLLINHPLDCPICDQGGECDLQDQAMAYGHGISRYDDHKRAVEDKYMGPLVKTEMTRCIHCTRCVRFLSDVAGVPELGATGRGEHMEITTYVERALTSELSGNIIDLCPVGALTNKPYAFLARPWELEKTESIDVMDAVGSNIRIDSRGGAVLRILPRLNEDVNEEWIADKTRFACDGLRTQRLDRPYIRKDGKLTEASWGEAFGVIADKMMSLKGEEMAAIAGNLACAESMLALKDLMESLGSSNIDCRQDGAKIDHHDRASYLFNTSIAGIMQADVCLIIGADPRFEAPLINARLRQRYLQGGFKVYNLGAPVSLTFAVEELGNKPALLTELIGGTHPAAIALKQAQNPMVIIGQAALAREDGAAIMQSAKQLAKSANIIRDGWNGFNVLHNAASRVAGLDLGFVPSGNGKDIAGMIDGIASQEIKLLYLLGADEIDMNLFKGAFVIYQGHHGDDGAHRADVVLPGAAYTEKDATYVNTEGRVQQARRAVFPPGDAREDWKILRALSEVLGKTLPYNSLDELRHRLRFAAASFAQIDALPEIKTLRDMGAQGGAIRNAPFEHAILNFYMTDPISRASRTMAACTEAKTHNESAAA